MSELSGLSLLSLGLRAWWVFGPPQMQRGVRSVRRLSGFPQFLTQGSGVQGNLGLEARRFSEQ